MLASCGHAETVSNPKRRNVAGQKIDLLRQQITERLDAENPTRRRTKAEWKETSRRSLKDVDIKDIDTELAANPGRSLQVDMSDPCQIAVDGLTVKFELPMWKTSDFQACAESIHVDPVAMLLHTHSLNKTFHQYQ